MPDSGQVHFLLLETPAAVTLPLVKAHNEYHVFLGQYSADRVRHPGENHGVNLREKPEKKAAVKGEFHPALDMQGEHLEDTAVWRWLNLRLRR